MNVWQRISTILMAVIALSVILTLSGCVGTPTYEKAAEMNDRALGATVIALCDPLRLPAINRAYADQPQKLAAIRVICQPQ